MMEDFILAQMDMVTDSDLDYNEEIEEEEQDLYEEWKLKKIYKKEFDENE